MKTFNLWEGEVPALLEGEEPPVLEYYPAEKKLGPGTAVICPGGAYVDRARHEGEGYARFLNSIGLDAFVLQYRTKPHRFPAPLLDARRAMRLLRANAEKFGIDANKIAVIGSSAGGHLGALLSTYRKPLDGEGVDEIDGFDFLPNAEILCYPVLDIEGHRASFVNLLGEAHVSHTDYTPRHLADKNTPPLFLWHTSSDTGVDVNNSFRYAQRLHELGVAVEVHVYPVGGHGLGLANDSKHNCPYVRGWADNLHSWLRLMGFFS